MSSNTAMMDGPTSVGSMVNFTPLSLSSLYSFFHIGGQELGGWNAVGLECCGVVFGGGMPLRFQKQLGISLTFSIGDGEPAEIAVGYVILNSEAKGIDVKIVSAGNVVYRNGAI